MDRRGKIALAVGTLTVLLAVIAAIYVNRGGLGHVSSAELSWQEDCLRVDENTATAVLRFRGAAEGGSVSVGGTVTMVDARSGEVVGSKTVRVRLDDQIDVRLPVTIDYNESKVTGDTTCTMSMARTGWHWPGH